MISVSEKVKKEALEIVEMFYSNSNFLIKINKQNRMLLAKTSAILYVELLIKNIAYCEGEDFRGKSYFENLIKHIDDL